MEVRTKPLTTAIFWGTFWGILSFFQIAMEKVPQQVEETIANSH
jgi:hypothetical protein